MHLYDKLARVRSDAAEAQAGAGQRWGSPSWGRLLRSAAATALAAGAPAGPAVAAQSQPADASGGYQFTTLDNHADPTFNQLLGINDHGVIAGYFGSGQAGHPNKGYLLLPGGNYRNENFPGSEQTQVTGLNNTGVTVGFWANQKGDNTGFFKFRGRYHSVHFPNENTNPRLDQLLGVNDGDVAVGFFADAQNVNHGYTYNLRSHRYHKLDVAGYTNVTAAGINDLGDIAGFGTTSGATEAFLMRPGGQVIHLSYPGASSTQALGVNNGDEVVGDYTVGSGNSATMHGFVWVPGIGFSNIDDPNGVGATTINGLNDRGDLVGFYTDAQGNTHGLLARPQF